MDKKILRLLIVDDSPDDADLLCRDLRIARFMLKSQRVTDAAGMQAALEKSKWDIVVSEYLTPAFGAQQALNLLKQAKRHIPLIVFTHDISDEQLLSIMQAGARDVIIKDRAARLIPAMARELDAVNEYKELRRANRRLTEMEVKHRAMVEHAREAVCFCHEGMHIEVNQSYLELFGYESLEELAGVPVLDLIEKNGHGAFKEYLKKAGQGKTVSPPPQFQGVKKDGTRFDIEVTAVPVTIQGEHCVQIAVDNISKRKAAENRLKYLSQRDALTGLYNRQYFQQLLKDTIEQTGSNGDHHILLYLDLYDLNKINSSLGYSSGDRMLLKVTKLFREHLDEEAVIARIGGVIFAVLLKGKTEKQAAKISNNIRKALKQCPLSEKGSTYECHCTASMLPLDGELGNAQDILLKAQHLCEQKRSAAAKRSRSRKKKASATKAKKAAADTPTKEPTWQQRIQSALDNNAIKLMYQPIINLHGEAGEYYEVLSRIVDDNGELILPKEFIPEAEKTGQINAIDKWVIQHAIESQSALHQEGRAVTFFINLSPAAFSDQTLIPHIQHCVEENNITPRYIVFELDEPVVAQNVEAATQLISALNDQGCTVSLDNFGREVDTLLNLPPHAVRFLKIDGALIGQIQSDDEKESLEPLLEIAKKLDIKTVAKYIEDSRSLSDLWTFGFDYVQGDYFQQADSSLNYNFLDEKDETTLSSDNPLSSWRSLS